MTELVERPPALQEFKDIPPPTFKNERGGNYMLEVLDSRRLWKERPQETGKKDTILFLNLQSDRKYTFDGKTFVTETVDDLLNNGEGFNCVVLVTGPMAEGEQDVSRNLITAIASLKPGGSVFLFEKPEDRLEKPKDFVEKKWREEALEKAELVEINVLNSGRKAPGSILWEARTPQEKGLEHPIDLLESGPYYIDGMIGDMKKSYEKEGWSVVDIENSELYKKLRKSKFPLRDIHTLRDRFGVKIKSVLCPTSTCIGVVPIDTGTLEMINSCGEEHFPPEKATLTQTATESNKNGDVKNNVIDKARIEQHAPYCGDFPEHGEMQYDTGRKMYICPRCAGRD
ncbi:MAG: hypothetical protein Q7T54_03230 [Candidatus Levybacteria bacterium]|nr:hypothetical protein [Candidatus Levybacteria bacterium]